MTSVQPNTANKPKQGLTPQLPVLPSHQTPASQERKLSWCQINSPKNTFPRLRLAGVACKRRCPGGSWPGPRSSPGEPGQRAGQRSWSWLRAQRGRQCYTGSTEPPSSSLPPSCGPVPAGRKKDPRKAGAGPGLWTDLDAAGPAL